MERRGGVRAGSGRRCSRGPRSRAAGTGGWRPLVTGVTSGRSSARPAAWATSMAARLSASPTPWPRTASSTMTSSIQARRPDGMRNSTSVRVPTMRPSSFASRSSVAGEVTISATSSVVGAGADEESCGRRRATAATTSGVASVAITISGRPSGHGSGGHESRPSAREPSPSRDRAVSRGDLSRSRPSTTMGGMQNLLRWFYAAGTAGAVRNAGAVLNQQHQAEQAVDALARRLQPAAEPRRAA